MKTTVLRSFKYMQLIIIILTALGAYIDYKEASFSVVMYVFLFLSSELPIRMYYSGKPLLQYGGFYDSKTEDDIATNMWLHLGTIFIVFLTIVGNIVLMYWDKYF